MERTYLMRDKVLALRDKGTDSLRFGESLSYEILANRLRQDKTYIKGRVRRFQNFEETSVIRSLDNLLLDTKKELTFELSYEMKELFEYKHKINNMNFIYDAIMFLDDRRKSFEEIKEFLGERIITLSKELPPGRTEYNYLMTGIRKDIADMYNIIFD